MLVFFDGLIGHLEGVEPRLFCTERWWRWSVLLLKRMSGYPVWFCCLSDPTSGEQKMMHGRTRVIF